MLNSAWGLLGPLLALLLALYAALMALLWWGQERLLFHPAALPQTHRFAFGPEVQEAWIDVPGARLHALHLQLPQPKGIVFFLHGNAGHLQGWFGAAALYRQAGYDVFMLDYRGYGKSSGHIQGEAQLHADVAAAWALVAPRYAGLRRVLVGQSLGTGLAAALALQVQPDLTLLVSPYVSMQALAKDKFPWVPSALLRYPLRTDLALPQLLGQVLMLHGTQDELIPPEHSARLQALVPQAQLVLVPNAGHNDIDQHPAYREAVLQALARR
jgi:alpha-beta hydrolase superfamily lysophospholipase